MFSIPGGRSGGARPISGIESPRLLGRIELPDLPKEGRSEAKTWTEAHRIAGGGIESEHCSFCGFARLLPVASTDSSSLAPPRLTLLRFPLIVKRSTTGTQGPSRTLTS